jgi:hypothetical protein
VEAAEPNAHCRLRRIYYNDAQRASFKRLLCNRQALFSLAC